MSTSKLQRFTGELLRKNFGSLDILENHRPDWLIGPTGERLELDFYIPQLNLAVEVQGIQHYQRTEFFQKEDSDFRNRIVFDQFKRRACSDKSILLVEVASESDAENILNIIANSIKPEPTDEQVWKKIDRLVEYAKKYWKRQNKKQLTIQIWKIYHLCQKYRFKVPDIMHRLKLP